MYFRMISMSPRFGFGRGCSLETTPVETVETDYDSLGVILIVKALSAFFPIFGDESGDEYGVNG